MDWFQIAANVVQIVGVLWVLAFGGKAVIDVIGELRKRIPIRINLFVILNFLCAAILVVLLGILVRPILLPIPNTFSPSASSTINLQLICQHCEQPSVVAFIKSYSIDPTGSTSLTVTFTNHTNSAVDLRLVRIESGPRCKRP